MNKQINSIYTFTLINKNGYVTQSPIRCVDFMEAYRIKHILLKSKNIFRVDFSKQIVENGK